MTQELSPAMLRQSCVICKHYRMHSEYGGNCRAHPPTLSEKDDGWLYPYVEVTDPGCGEFIPAEATRLEAEKQKPLGLVCATAWSRTPCNWPKCKCYESTLADRALRAGGIAPAVPGYENPKKWDGKKHATPDDCPTYYEGCNCDLVPTPTPAQEPWKNYANEICDAVSKRTDAGPQAEWRAQRSKHWDHPSWLIGDRMADALDAAEQRERQAVERAEKAEVVIAAARKVRSDYSSWHAYVKALAAYDASLTQTKKE